MFGRKAKMNKAAFNADVLTTFGKLNQEAIDKIDGQPHLLVNELVAQYGWEEAVARRRIVGIGVCHAEDKQN